jgi:hypothetical protein
MLLEVDTNKLKETRRSSAKTIVGSMLKPLSQERTSTMSTLSQPQHVFKTGDTFVAAKVEFGTLILADTRNEEHASEGRFGNLITVIPLQEAIAIAKVVLSAQQQANAEAAYDAWIEQQYEDYLDYQALVDDALAHEISF